MKIQQLHQAAQAAGLEDWGTAGLPGAEATRLFGRQYMIPGNEAVDTGVFECEPGSWRRSVEQAEVMHFLSGSGTFTPDGGEAIHFRGGDTLFFAANTEGLWQIHAKMRKIYVIF